MRRSVAEVERAEIPETTIEGAVIYDAVIDLSESTNELGNTWQYPFYGDAKAFDRAAMVAMDKDRRGKFRHILVRIPE